MKKNLNFLLVVFVLFSCTKNENVENKTTEYKILKEPIKITNENLNQLKISDYYHNEILNPFPINFKGFELSGQFRYMVNYGDEDNEKILNLYKIFGFKEITTMYEFTNVKKDTIYYFPLTDKKYSKIQFGQFNKNKDSSKLLNIYANLYYKKDLGKIIVIDSIK